MKPGEEEGYWINEIIITGFEKQPLASPGSAKYLGGSIFCRRLLIKRAGDLKKNNICYCCQRSNIYLTVHYFDIKFRWRELLEGL